MPLRSSKNRYPRVRWARSRFPGRARVFVLASAARSRGLFCGQTGRNPLPQRSPSRPGAEIHMRDTRATSALAIPLPRIRNARAITRANQLNQRSIQPVDLEEPCRWSRAATLPKPQPRPIGFRAELACKIFFAGPHFPSIFAPHRIRRVTVMCAA